jgi:hypothetical protein
LFKGVDQIDGGKEPHLLAVMLNGLHAQGGGHMALAGPGRTSDILPGITTPKDRFFTPFIRDMAYVCRLRGGIGIKTKSF